MSFSTTATIAVIVFALGLLAFFTLAEDTEAAQGEIRPPAPRREFRGVWVATVANIDWPTRRDLTTEQQKAELIAMLERAKALNLNAVVFQVRPAADALYASDLEPWSEYLTGTQGKAPEPFYDPLAFVVEEAHRRGLELHAWLNPYRARHSGARSEIAASHLSKTQPELVKTYGTHLWMDPGEPDVQEHSLKVVLDVVRRYDVDGVHLDDYFYPYKERDAAGKIIDFPDEASYGRYRQGGGTLVKDDWRRQNVDTFIQRMYEGVKAAKPHVKVGISPFGIWRPGNPAQIQGFDQYSELYADARKWILEGWVDYFTPQLYWKIETKAQSYPVLLNWWTTQNPKNRHIWPGNYTGRAAGDRPNAWPDDEIEYQVRATRGQAGATGNIHFSERAFRPGAGDMGLLSGLGQHLADTVYAEPALIPASPWLSEATPLSPIGLTLTGDAASESGALLSWRAGGTGAPFVYVVQTRTGEQNWTTTVLPGGQRTLTVKKGAAADAAPITAVAVTAVDRLGNASPPATLAVPAPPPQP